MDGRDSSHSCATAKNAGAGSSSCSPPPDSEASVHGLFHDTSTVDGTQIGSTSLPHKLTSNKVAIAEVKQLPQYFSSMSEIRVVASLARNGRTSVSTDEKSDVLRRLQGRIYFEKILSASSVSCPGKTMILPTWFVEDHGYKFQNSVILRPVSSTKSWNVKLSITHLSSTRAKVFFSAGWKAFTTSNGLREGDSLVFALTTMSEFEVHIFPGSRNPKLCPPRAGRPRKRSSGSEPSRKKARQAYECKDDQVADGDRIDGGVKSNRLFPKKRTVEEELGFSASRNSSSSYSLSSSSEDLHYFESDNVREPALDHVEPMVSGVAGNLPSEIRAASMARKGRMPFSADDKSEVLRKLQGSVHFEKILAATNVGKRKSTLILPAWFVKKHGDKFQRSVILRSESSTKSWDVKLTIECLSPSASRVTFSAGWKAFATFHDLLEGDSLIFVLTAMSKFEVHIFRSTRSKKRWPVFQAPRMRCNGHKLSRKRPEQSYECEDERLAAEDNVKGYTVKLNRGLFAKVQEVGEQYAVSLFGNSSTSCTGLHNFPGFLKKLTVSNICHRTGSARETARMEIPLDFCKTYSSRLHSFVKVQGIRKDALVRTVACLPTRGNPKRHFLRAGWRDFANENNLQVGQELLFTLTADSFFNVRKVLPPSGFRRGK